MSCSKFKNDSRCTKNVSDNSVCVHNAFLDIMFFLTLRFRTNMKQIIIYISHWTYHLNLTYIRRSREVLHVILTSYISL